MNAFFKMTWTDLKLFSRQSVELFFTFAFPILNIIIFGGIYGNTPSPYFGGHGAADTMIPGYIATLVIGTTAFMNLPLEIASRRQTGVLRRFRASPLHPGIVIGSQVVVGLLTVALSSTIMIVTGRLAFGAALPANLAAFGLGCLVCCLSLDAFTFFLSSLVRNATSARAVFMAIFFPMMFLSGGTLPIQFLPDTMQKIAAWLPLTYAVNLLKGLYFDSAWDLTALAVLGGLLVVGSVLAIKAFRWE